MFITKCTTSTPTSKTLVPNLCKPEERCLHETDKTVEASCPVTINIQNLKCLYNNADQLPNKLNELKDRIELCSPDIIAITEVKPKNPKATNQLSEIALPNYNMVSVNIASDEGRGIVKDILRASPIVLQTSYTEYIAIRITFDGNKQLLFTSIYRSGSGTDENNRNLITLIEEITDLKPYLLAIVGDFILPEINWDTWTTKSSSTDSLGFTFIESLRDCYLLQHISNPTTGRGESSPNILDLLITNNSTQIQI